MNDSYLTLIKQEISHHHWLKVPLKELVELSIDDDISQDSLTDGEFIYLYHIYDLNIYEIAREIIGNPINYDEVKVEVVNYFAWNPNLRHYENPHWVIMWRVKNFYVECVREAIKKGEDGPIITLPPGDGSVMRQWFSS